MEGTPDRITIEIDLARLLADVEAGTFADYIAELAAQRLMVGKTAQEATGEYRRRALTIADEEIREQLKPVIAQALEASVQRTSTFGENRGEPKSLREVIVESAIEQLRKPQGDGFGGTRRGETLVQFVIREEVKGALAKELREAVQDAKKDVLVAVREQAAEIVTETIERIARSRV